MARWPGQLGIPMLDGYSVVDDSPLIRTEMESGPDRVSLKTRHYMTRGSFSLMLTKKQADAMRYFIYVGLKDGAEWIDDMPLDTGRGVLPHRARLSNMRFTPIVPNRLWRFTCDYETDQRK